MTPEETQDFIDFEEMFGTVGWQKFVKRLLESHDSTLASAPANAMSNDQWQYCRGKLDQMQQIAGFETFVAAVKEQLEEQDAEENG